MSDTKTKAPTIAQIMKQAQEFASAWSLVSGLFDRGGALAVVEAEKLKLRDMVTAALASKGINHNRKRIMA